mgnify:CR=1 FL=1
MIKTVQQAAPEPTQVFKSAKIIYQGDGMQQFFKGPGWRGVLGAVSIGSASSAKALLEKHLNEPKSH